MHTSVYVWLDRGRGSAFLGVFLVLTHHVHRVAAFASGGLAQCKNRHSIVLAGHNSY